MNWGNKETKGEKDNRDLRDTTLIKNPDGSLTIDIDPSADFHRKLQVEAPQRGRHKYVGTYKKVPGSKYQITGTITIDPTVTPIKSQINVQNASYSNRH